MDILVKSLKTRCAAAGTNITAICEKAGVSRSTIERWKKAPPQSIRILNAIEAAIEAAMAEQGADQYQIKEVSLDFLQDAAASGVPYGKFLAKMPSGDFGALCNSAGCVTKVRSFQEKGNAIFFLNNIDMAANTEPDQPKTIATGSTAY